jgi:hypothetical protein
MNINQLKELVKEVMSEEQDYKALFKHWQICPIWTRRHSSMQ